jgi:hypothetical protein
MHFEIVGRITETEIIAVGPGIRILGVLRKRYGRGRWRKLKELPPCAFLMVGYGLLKCTGSKRME